MTDCKSSAARITPRKSFVSTKILASADSSAMTKAPGLGRSSTYCGDPRANVEMAAKKEAQMRRSATERKVGSIRCDVELLVEVIPTIVAEVTHLNQGGLVT